MIIQTRYRDIPFDEIAYHCKTVTAEKWEARYRAKSISVETPSIPLNQVHRHTTDCRGPFYRIWPYVLRNGGALTVCPCVAEIGD